MSIAVHTPLRMVPIAAALIIGWVAGIKFLITGEWELRSLLVPGLLFGVMYWVAMSTMSERGQINAFLRSHGLLRTKKGSE